MHLAVGRAPESSGRLDVRSDLIGTWAFVAPSNAICVCTNTAEQPTFRPEAELTCFCGGVWDLVYLKHFRVAETKLTEKQLESPKLCCLVKSTFVGMI